MSGMGSAWLDAMNIEDRVDGCDEQGDGAAEWAIRWHGKWLTARGRWTLNRRYARVTTFRGAHGLIALHNLLPNGGDDGPQVVRVAP